MNRNITFSFLGAACVVLVAATGTAKPVAKPSWLSTVTQSDRGGHIIGNPAAATKVVEYASYTCSHCAHFEAVDAPVLKSQYVAGGKVSFEIRNLARDSIDLTMAMLARCGGKGKFFGNHKLLMANQVAVMTKGQSLSASAQAKLQKEDYTGFMVDAYGQLGLGKIMAQRGISDVQAKACLADKASLARILAMTNEATGPLGFQGTPGFLVDGKVAQDVYGWDALKPLLPAK